MFQFEQESRNFMEKNLRHGLGLRPNHLRGYYLFPDCYNHKWGEPGYTGKCSDKTKAQNNELMWMWNCSTALFLTIYISEDLRNSPNAKIRNWGADDPTTRFCVLIGNILLLLSPSRRELAQGSHLCFGQRLRQ